MRINLLRLFMDILHGEPKMSLRLMSLLGLFWEVLEGVVQSLALNYMLVQSTKISMYRYLLINKAKTLKRETLQ